MNSSVTTILLILGLSALQIYADKDHGFFIPKRRSTPRTHNEDDNKRYWNAVAESELEEALHTVQNNNVAKNVILFLGDGMGISTVTAARIYDGQNKGGNGEENFLRFEKFPHVGLSKTYAVDHQVSDSAGTGTAYLCGVKTNKGVIGFDARVDRGECDTVTDDSVVYSIAKWSQDKGKKTGVVTSTRITHATPANIYAHVPDRNWECDDFVPSHCTNVKDIARQLIEDEPGKNLNVIMGGGFQELDGDAKDLPDDDVDKDDCVRKDGRKLWKEWLDEKQSAGKTAAFVRTKSQLDDVDLSSTEYLMGIFANNHIPYEYEKREDHLDLPTISEMTEAAIKMLDKGNDGYFLLVEGGRIDTSHHSNKAHRALDEAVAMNEAIVKALELTNDEETLIVVTADHSHTMTINGYPKRGNDILGIAEDDSDDIPFTTLTYGDGPGYDYSVSHDEAVRHNPEHDDLREWSYRQQATIRKSTATHGGEDVAIYANGPMAHLFHSVHEENYIAHAIAYASCVDKEEKHCQNRFNGNFFRSFK